MAGGMQGADPERLRTIATMFDAKASTVDGARRTSDTEVEGVEWIGRDADGFRDDWRAVPSAELDRLDDLLIELAAELRRQADEQERASEARGGSGGAGESGTPASTGEIDPRTLGIMSLIAMTVSGATMNPVHFGAFALSDLGSQWWKHMTTDGIEFGSGNVMGWDWRAFQGAGWSWGANAYGGTEHYPGNFTEWKGGRKGGERFSESKHKLDEGRGVFRLGGSGELIMLGLNATRSVDVPVIGPLDLSFDPYAGARANLDLIELKAKRDFEGAGLGASTYGAKIGVGGFVGAEVPISASRSFGDGFVTAHGTAAGRLGASAEAGAYAEMKNGVLSFGGKGGAGLGFGGSLRGGLAIDFNKAPGPIKNFVPGL